MKVLITDRGHGTSYTFDIVEVEIADTCQKCGGPRGTPTRNRYCEDGEFYYVDNWTNPCGHVDRYLDVLREAKALKGEIHA
ncbi:hypothetical protein ACFFU8_17935 [Chromobacterium piscinae]|uniref:hypothetical protein n=1 Tax=Chromobacterium piscinae TaxID=686831 RepID=UPI001E61A87A|nr:hypothetical protein [Chromobacterium piscinae]MCD5326804.1 hypothetical protein [Chromobacterium piscinae]